MTNNATQVAVRYVKRFGQSGPYPVTVKEVRSNLVVRRQCARTGHKFTIGLGHGGPESGSDGASCRCGRNSFEVTLY